MSVLTLAYTSEVLRNPTEVAVLHPEPGMQGPFHVMFLLHGMFGSRMDWLQKSRIQLYVEQLPLIVVMPEGGRSFYTDAAEGFRYGEAFGSELPNVIEGTFKTKAPWCVTGLSMGGYGALRMALTYPKRFASAASMSGALSFGRQPYGHDAETRAEFARLAGPKLAGGPNDLHFLADRLAKSDSPKISVDCGAEDHLIDCNREFDRYLSSIDFGHRYAEYPGAHDWDYWDLHVRDALDFHSENLGLNA